MDFFFFDKAEKPPTAIPRSSCNLLQIFAKVFRFLELCLLLVFLSWILSRLPFAVRISGEYFTKLFAFVASPLFGFILCNAIIVALVAKPSQLSGRRVAVGDGGETDRLYEDLIVKSGNGDLPESPSEDGEIVFQDKEIIAEAINSIDRDVEVKSTDPEAESGIDHPKVIRRTLSEKIKRECSKTQSEKLRRSETEKCRNILEQSHDIVYYQDDLSSEEFQRKIEAFIAREKKFRREESSAIVLHSD
ncbi:uncharacterized protein LOC111008461, partial [Momordica charantia]|uniref:Uncharacterized protein LOC111008461 n=1 Tax=Momordica charantia TaxID=3673 RepID=A0A6J1C5K3_MOMCH